MNRSGSSTALSLVLWITRPFGVELLFGKEQRIRSFVKEDTWDSIIREAIARHSDYEVGDGLDARTLLHARMIRDADKLDNCRVKLEDKIEVLLGCGADEAGSQEISQATWEECLEGKSIHSANRKPKWIIGFPMSRIFLTLIFRPQRKLSWKTSIRTGSFCGFPIPIRIRKGNMRLLADGSGNSCKRRRLNHCLKNKVQKKEEEAAQRMGCTLPASFFAQLHNSVGKKAKGDTVEML